MKRFIVGDIHARFDLLRNVLDKAGFNEAEDVLYSVGDLCDRGDKPVETLFFLMSLRDFRPVLGIMMHGLRNISVPVFQILPGQGKTVEISHIGQ